MKSHCRSSCVKQFCIAVALVAFFFLLTPPVFAQTQEIQKLKDELARLEKEVGEVRQQIGAIEQAQKPPGAPAAPEPPTAPSAPPTRAQEATPDESQVTYQPKTLDIYGYAMLDSGYQFGTNDPNWFDVVRPTKLPSFSGEFAPNGKTFFGVRQTRFGVKSFTPTDFGDLKTIFEFELFGTGVDAGQTTFRLRHAYGELGHFGAGQYWSPFMDIDIFPNSIEYWGPNGMAFFRNVQVRWMPIQGDTRLTFALERPGSSQDPGRLQDRIEIANVLARFPSHDISGELRWGGKRGYLEAAGIIGQTRLDDVLNDRFNLNQTVDRWGINLTSNLKVGAKDVLKAGFFFGQGMKNYMNDPPADIAATPNFGNPTRPIRGKALPFLGLVAFYDHYWSDRWSTSAGY